jgi:hypothetical protein
VVLGRGPNGSITCLGKRSGCDFANVLKFNCEPFNAGASVAFRNGFGLPLEVGPSDYRITPPQLVHVTMPRPSRLHVDRLARCKWAV